MSSGHEKNYNKQQGTAKVIYNASLVYEDCKNNNNNNNNNNEHLI